MTSIRVVRGREANFFFAFLSEFVHVFPFVLFQFFRRLSTFFSDRIRAAKRIVSTIDGISFITIPNIQKTAETSTGFALTHGVI